jgi:hypothetical protein
MRKLMLIVAAVLAAGLALAAGAQAFTLGFNDRWDRVSTQAHWVRDIGGTSARVFVTASLSGDPAYWTWLQGQVANLNAAGVDTTFVLTDEPSYGGRDSTDPALFASAARQLVALFPAGPIEVYNEPNWRMISVTDFVPIFRAVYRVIHRAQPARLIVAPGLAQETIGGVAWTDWLRSFVSQTGGRSYACNLHEYVQTVAHVVSDLAAIRSICGTRAVRVTEIGVSRNWGVDQATILPAEIRALADRGVSFVNIHTMFDWHAEGWSMLSGDTSSPATSTIFTPLPVYYAIQSLMASYGTAPAATPPPTTTTTPTTTSPRTGFTRAVPVGPQGKSSVRQLVDFVFV